MPISDRGDNHSMLCLSITGFDVDPNRVTNIIELVPTRVARKGEVGSSGRTHNFNGWWHDVHEERMTDGGTASKALDGLLQTLTGREERFFRLRELIKPDQITVYGGLYHDLNEQCGIWLTVDQMRLLATLGIEWGLDLFSHDL